MDDMAELVRLAQEGDDTAFDELVRLTLSGTYRFLRSLGAGEDDATDAAQTTYVNAWRSLDSFDASRPFVPWLYQIARRALYDVYRKQTRSPALLEDAVVAESILDPEPLPDALFDREESRKHVRSALSKLGTNEQAILMLRYDEEFSFEDIAVALSMPPGTVRSIHHRALAKLRKLLEQLL